MHRGDNFSSIAGGTRSAPSLLSPSHFLSGVRYEHLVSGVAGGTLATLVLHPLDLIKVRFAGTCSECGAIDTRREDTSGSS